MYLRYFGFQSYPFAVTPDPAFLYLSASHREALAHLLYGAGEHGGFVSLIGEVGTGKTTLIRAVADSELPDLDIALCWNPHLTVHEFVATVCDELGVAGEADEDSRQATLKSLTDRLNRHLLAAHADNRRTVLIIDEAQNLSRDVLEQLRLLTNLETHKNKLLRIILVGQPELSDLLARHDLRQLAQRITARSVLKPLGPAETRAYIQHRLECANGPQHLFSRTATLAVRLVTGGVPRLVNIVCERALMGAYAHGRSHVGPWTVLRAARESLPRRGGPRVPGGWRLALPTGAVAGALMVLALAWLPDIPLTKAADWVKARALTDNATEQAAPAIADTDVGTGDDDTSTPTSEAAAAPEADTAPLDATSSDDNAAPPADTVSAADSTSTEGPDTPTRIAALADDGNDASDESGTETDPSSEGGDATDETDDTADVVPQGSADLNQLLRLWGVFGSQVQTDCDSLNVGDLRCLADRGSLGILRRYNRPALLDLERDGKQQTVLLTSLNGQTVTLVGASDTRDVSIAELNRYWTGRFRVVWRADAGVRLIRPGSVGNAVVWLRNRLDRIDGDNPDARAGRASPVYDEALGERLQAFQKSRGLTADGLAGPRTQMMLNGAVPSPGTPALRSVGSGSS